MINNSPKTIFCDIDGTLLKHHGDAVKQSKEEPILLQDVLKKLKEWDRKGYNIILVTGRRESAREITKKQLEKVGIFYDRLIMGIGGGERVVINDKKPNGRLTAYSINLERNGGLSDIEI